MTNDETSNDESMTKVEIPMTKHISALQIRQRFGNHPLRFVIRTSNFVIHLSLEVSFFEFFPYSTLPAT